MNTYHDWARKVTRSIHQATFGAEIPSQFLGGGSSNPNDGPASSARDNGDGTGTFTNYDNQPSLPTSHGASADLNNADPTSSVVQAATSPGAIAGAVAGTAFGPLGTLLGGGLGAIAQAAYDAATSANTPGNIVNNRPQGPADVSPTDVPPSATPTPAQSAHDLGTAVAHGVSKVVNGQAPPPVPGLSQAQEAARLAAHGLDGAPDAIKRGVSQIIPPAAQPGFNKGAVEASSGGWIAWGVLAGILGLSWWASKKKTVKTDEHR